MLTKEEIVAIMRTHETNDDFVMDFIAELIVEVNKRYEEIIIKLDDIENHLREGK